MRGGESWVPNGNPTHGGGINLECGNDRRTMKTGILVIILAIGLLGCSEQPQNGSPTPQNALVRPPEVKPAPLVVETVKMAATGSNQNRDMILLRFFLKVKGDLTPIDLKYLSEAVCDWEIRDFMLQEYYMSHNSGTTDTELK
jgi:hypothetical protein